ncbi:hypothetical protein COK98_31445 [Bacillus cereus]|uniref:Uncharacterized protein n=1 Tax=Bacillus cereus TaxID=1396 RepID=A0A9X7B5Q1_BACCE|nr:hypothetical protein CON26_31035 [Bacillus cereus]PFV00292.1 hypothetical protein COK98_31445 [Bacillus cereus]
MKKHPIAIVIQTQNPPNLTFMDNIEQNNEISTIVSTTKDESRILKSDTKYRFGKTNKNINQI